MYYYNVFKDMVFGYVEVRCCNKLCNRVLKVSRNLLETTGPNNFSCNMGCAYGAYNQTQQNLSNN